MQSEIPRIASNESKAACKSHRHADPALPRLTRLSAHFYCLPYLACIDATLPYFALEMGQPSTLPGYTLWSILSQCFAQFSSIFQLDDRNLVLATAANQKKFLGSIFSSDSLALVTQDSLFILDHLDGHARAMLLAQAVAGMVMVFHRLAAAGTEITSGLLSRQLRLFSESQELRGMLSAVEGSPVLKTCYVKSEIASMITRAARSEQHFQLPLTTVGEERLSDGISWVSYRPCQDMGMPWGFTIMALN